MNPAAKPFRRNVCVVLTDAEQRLVLVFHRIGQEWLGDPWQFPQGGLEEGETPEQGMRRELAEEVGSADIDLLRHAPEPVRYEFPPEVVRRLEQDGSRMARFRGQEQHWFLARLRQGTAAIHFRHQPPEFDAFRWATPQEAVALVVPFKRAAYIRGLTALGLLADEGQG
jgi:putative (di)nucleoside polyphosphate hydrolase